MAQKKINLDGEHLTIDAIVAVARHRAPVRLATSVRAKIERAAQLVTEWASSGEIIYGVTTGFGPFSDVVIHPNMTKKLQHSLLISHAAGVGDPLPTEVVRAAMLLRANTLAKGNSGIRLITLETLIALLNRGVHPIIPTKGSVGASGDLAPLAHMALVLIGEGYAEYDGEVLSGAEALHRAKVSPITLERKEGVALINGTQIMTAIAALVVADARNLIASAEVASALSIEALEGVLDPFDPRLHSLRPHPGQQQTAQNVLLLLKGSSQSLTSRQRLQLANAAKQQLQNLKVQTQDLEKEAINELLQHAAQYILELDKQLAVEPEESVIALRKHRVNMIKLMQRFGVSPEMFDVALRAARHTPRVQDAYSLRCVPQVLGAVRDALDYVATVVTTEINSATDNPLIFPRSKAFLSGGNFHGQPIAIAMDLLTLALTSLGTIAERRIARLIDPHLSDGLPLLLLHPIKEEYGVQFGLGLAQITAAALVAECKTLSSPASILTIPTSANQEDHVSMGVIAARQTREVIFNLENIVAIELLCAAQGVDLRKLYKKVRLGRGTQIAFKTVRDVVPRIVKETDHQSDRLTQDTLIHRDIEHLRGLIHNRTLLHQIKKKVPGYKP